jgi:hypothetical protein
MVTRLLAERTLEESGFDYRQALKIFFSLYRRKYLWGLSSYFVGAKQPRREGKQLPPCSAGI